MADDADLKQVNYRLPQSLVAQIKSRARVEGMSTTALVEKALTAYLANPDEAVVQPSDTLFVSAVEFMALKQQVEEMGDRLGKLRVA